MTRRNKREPFNIPNIIDSLKTQFHARAISLTDVASELCRAGWTNYIDLNRAAELVGAVDIPLTFCDRGKTSREFFIRLEPHGESFRFTCCPQIRHIQPGETLENAARRELAGVTRETWPNNSEFWIDCTK